MREVILVAKKSDGKVQRLEVDRKTRRKIERILSDDPDKKSCWPFGKRKK
jgi:hypothetical protein